MPSPLSSDQVVSALIRLIQSTIRSAYVRPRSPDDSIEDVFHNVFLVVLRRLPQFDPRRSSLRTFVARITESALIDRARRLSADKRNPCRHPDRRQDDRRIPPDQFPAANESDVLRDLALDLKDAISKLPHDLEHLARDLQQWTPDEIAARDGVHPGTIYRRIARLRERWEDSSLKDYLDP